MASVVQSHRDLIVWQKAMDLVVMIYEATSHFPQEERYGLTAQMRRCVVSIPCNIAEGRRRKTKKDYGHFLQMAFGSGAELETQIEISVRLNWLKGEQKANVEALLEEIMKILNVMTTRLA